MQKKVKKRNIKHINSQIPPIAHTPMYNWHKFWARKTWNVVGECIENYCPKGGVVFDPFVGSGITAFESLKHGRRVIVSDLLPIATEIIRLTIMPIEETQLLSAYRRVEEKISKKIKSLYLTKCRKCGYEFPFTCSVWEQGKMQEIRYERCPRCGDRREKNCVPQPSDKALLKKLESEKIKEWYPNQKLYHKNGLPFKEKQQYESLDGLFSKRNLHALALLMETIESEPKKTLRDFLKICFSSMVHLCSTMCPISEAGHFTPFSSSWIQHSYWYPSGPHVEQNVWLKYKSAMLGPQGLVRAKNESNRYFKKIKITTDFNQVLKKKAHVCIYSGSCFDLVRKMKQVYGEKGCIDYIFTDPPYGASIQYGELAYLWVAWLKKDKGYLEKIASDEVVRNKRQEKSFEVYHSLLKKSFNNMYTVLKKDCYLTLTFHNPTFKVRNATIRAGVFAGFEFQKIHHQELARPSSKSLIQPFGSAHGDFYLRFYKPLPTATIGRPVEIDEKRFEKIVVTTTIDVLAERGEPTPYTIIVNTIDPELAKQGYFSELHTGLNVNTVLKKHLGEEFILVPVKLGNSEGEAWWFKDISIVPHLKDVPLSERVENTVLRILQKLGKVTFTEMWKAVNEEFPNSRTTDRTSIKEALSAFAHAQTSDGSWLIKPNAKEAHVKHLHAYIITILARMGKSQGYKIWIGRKEQSDNITDQSADEGKLKSLMSLKSLKGIKKIKNIREAERIDVLWIKKKTVAQSFEVEIKTSMTESLNRGSNLDKDIPKYIVMPEERTNQFIKKLRSPLFAERYSSDNWNIIIAEKLISVYTKRRRRLKPSDLIEKKIEKKTLKRSKKRKQTEQLPIFGDK